MEFGKRRVTKLLSLMVVASMGMPVKAAFAFGFVPPPDNETPRQTSAGGAARGDTCLRNLAVANADANEMADEMADGMADEMASSVSSAMPSVMSSAMPSVMPVETMPVAMLPEGNYGKTLQSHPTFLIYVPPSEIDGLLFVLKDEAGNILYAQDLSLMALSGKEPSGASGIISITLPDDAPSLAINQNYLWQVAFKCNGLISPNSHFIQGWVERAETPVGLTTETAQTVQTAFEQAEFLSSVGIWYDSVSTLATLVYPEMDNSGAQTSSTMLNSWEEFLASVGLDSFSAIPVVRP